MAQSRGKRRGIACVAATLAVTCAVALLVAWLRTHAPDGDDVRWIKDVLAPDGAVLKNVLVPRVPGTDGHAAVRGYIAAQLARNGWDVHTDDFSHGGVPMANVVAAMHAAGGPGPRTVLAAHYDSKASVTDGTRDGFLGATDAAWSVALLLALSRRLPSVLSTLSAPQTVELVFFDGEETQAPAPAGAAVATFWSDADALLGSRHLAARWEAAGRLADIRLFVLLDLLGARDMALRSMFPETRPHFARLAAHEAAIRGDAAFLSQLCIVAGRPSDCAIPPALHTDAEVAGRFVRPDGTPGFSIVDDHVAFAQRGVPVLALVAAPFPRVWHTPGDDASALDAGRCALFAASLWAFLRDLLADASRDL